MTASRIEGTTSLITVSGGGGTGGTPDDGSVSTIKIVNGAVTTPKLADGSVTSIKIADGSIVDADVSPTAGIALSKIAGLGTLAGKNAVGSADILDGSIVDADVSPTAAIALSKLAVDPLARASHTGTQLAATISDFASAVGAVSGGVSPTLWDAHSIVKANVNDVPVAMIVGPSTFVGRKATGSIVALTPAEAKGELAIAPSDLTVDPLARANHTGTQLAATISDFASAVGAVGGGGMQVRTPAADSIAIGNNALGTATTATIQNIAYGTSTLGACNGANTGNVAIGYAALSGNPASSNVAIGSETLLNSSATGSVAIGYQAGRAGAGSPITSVGYQAGKATTSAGHTFVGYLAGTAVAAGVNNTLVGYQAGKALASASDNTFLGYNAGLTASGNANVGIGASASVGAGNAYNIAIGASASATAPNTATAIGYTATASGENSIAIGPAVSASAAGSVAIGRDSSYIAASTAVADEIKLGTALHKVVILGTLTVAGKAITGPAAPNTGWSVTAGYTADKTLNPETTTVTEVARVLGTLIDALKTAAVLAS